MVQSHVAQACVLASAIESQRCSAQRREAYGVRASLIAKQRSPPAPGHDCVSSRDFVPTPIASLAFMTSASAAPDSERTRAGQHHDSGLVHEGACQDGHLVSCRLKPSWGNQPVDSCAYDIARSPGGARVEQGHITPLHACLAQRAGNRLLYRADGLTRRHKQRVERPAPADADHSAICCSQQEEGLCPAAVDGRD